VSETLALLAEYPPLLLVTVGLFGLAVGSFLNVVIYRLPVMMERDWGEQCRELLDLPQETPAPAVFNLVRPASRCPSCGHSIRAWENIPVFSWLFLRGRCSACRTAISPRYPLVELAAALLSIAVAARFGYTPQTLAALPLTWALIALGMIDYDKKLLPDDIVLPLLWLGLLLSPLHLFANPVSAIIGAAAGYLSLWSVYWVFKLATGKEGMGYGDFKLLAMFGAWLGWQSLPQVILLSSLVGAAAGIALILFAGRDRSSQIPFGPYLAAAGWIALMWGDRINQSYFHLFAGG